MPKTIQQVTELTSLFENQSHLPIVGEGHLKTPTWSLRENDVYANPVSDFDKMSCSKANILHESNIIFFAISRLILACLKGIHLPDNFLLRSLEKNLPLQLPFKFPLNHALMQSFLRNFLEIINIWILFFITLEPQWVLSNMF